MDIEKLFDQIVRTAVRWSPKGEKRLSKGVRLICPTPHLGPESWLHVLFPPLAPEKVKKMEENLGVPLPNDFRGFLQQANGLMLFNYRISVWGLRERMVRLGEDEAWFPHDLVDHNFKSMRPDGSPQAIVFFAGADDGDTWCFFEPDGERYRVGKTARHTFHPSAYWPDFGAWLLSEIGSLEMLFNADGLMRTNS